MNSGIGHFSPPQANLVQYFPAVVGFSSDIINILQHIKRLFSVIALALGCNEYGIYIYIYIYIYLTVPNVYQIITHVCMPKSVKMLSEFGKHETISHFKEHISA